MDTEFSISFFLFLFIRNFLVQLKECTPGGLMATLCFKRERERWREGVRQAESERKIQTDISTYRYRKP